MECPFTEEHFQQAKSIWDELAKIEDEIMVRINFQGETFIDEWAKRCCFYINKIPNVRICEFITNNSVSPETYLGRLDLRKTSFNCSFHPEFMSIERFIENALMLRRAGCNVFANICTTPQIIAMIPEINSTFREHGICLKLQGFLAFTFHYKGKRYPAGFTVEEHRILKQYFDSPEEYAYIVDLKQTKGLDCYAGVDMINLFLNGSVSRCFTYSIGSIKDLLSGKAKLKDDPYPCHEDMCPCYAHFIGLKEFRGKHTLSEKFVDNYDI